MFLPVLFTRVSIHQIKNMPMVVWGQLTKSAIDSQKIEEAIDAKISDHNANPDAHGLADMALYAHRTGDVLDHLDEAVKNIKITKKARSFTAIVGPSGDVDYTDIQAAINYVRDLGGGTILILPGTYDLSATLNLYDNISLIGFDKDLVIVKMLSTTHYMIDVIAPPGFYNTGTISINHNTAIVTGTGTAWLANVNAGDYISLDDVLYQIASVDSDTQLTLKDTYFGANLSGASYGIAPLMEGVEIKHLTLERVTSRNSIGINAANVSKVYIDDCIIRGQDVGIFMEE